MTRVGILGATGYTALELVKLLLRHPGAEVTLLGSRQDDRPHVSSVHPQLHGRLDLCLEQADVETLRERTDFVFSCLPHAASAETVKPLVDAGLQVVDLSADYRLEGAAAYRRWYDHEHPDPQRAGRVPYGLPELYREQIRGARLVANPGCFPTSAILGLTPLLRSGLVEPTGIVVDSKTGVSGGGRTPKLSFHFPECNEGVSAYGVGGHRHTPEIDEHLTRAAGAAVEVVFTPHLIPMDRGILTTAYATPRPGVDESALRQALAAAYRDEPFVQVVDTLPSTKHVAGTNFCHITARLWRGRAIVVSCIDNLIKGASGAAVQNFNLMCGHEETTGLR